jgi:predicted RNase H-like nuclease (RuvC/YqgF family)
VTYRELEIRYRFERFELRALVNEAQRRIEVLMPQCDLDQLNEYQRARMEREIMENLRRIFFFRNRLNDLESRFNQISLRSR